MLFQDGDHPRKSIKSGLERCGRIGGMNEECCNPTCKRIHLTTLSDSGFQTHVHYLKALLTK